MKKLIAMLLLMALLSTVLSSCIVTPGGSSSSDSSSDSSSESSSSESSSEQGGGENPSGLDLYTVPGVTTVYVDASAPLGGDGTAESPFRGVSEAYAAAAALSEDGVSVALYFREGKYVLTEELDLSGAENIAFVGTKKGDGATITSAVSIPGSEFSMKKGCYVYQFPDSAKDSEGKFPMFRDVMVNGERLTVTVGETARFALDSAIFATRYGVNKADELLYVRSSLVDVLSTDDEGYFVKKDAEGNEVRTYVELSYQVEWMLHTVRVDRVSPVTVSYKDPDTQEPLTAVHVVREDWRRMIANAYVSGGSLENCPYYFQNHYDLLDQDGEFYYDRDTGTIYIISETSPKKSTVEYALLERLFLLNDTDGISFENLTLTGTTLNYLYTRALLTGQAANSNYKRPDGSQEGFLTTALIFGKNVKNFTMNGCTVKGTGFDAVYVNGAVDGIEITNSIFEDIGCSAIRLGEASNTFNTAIHVKNVNIENNYFHDIANTVRSGPAVIATVGEDMTIWYNTFVDNNYSSISLGWCWTSLRSNGESYYNTEEYVNLKNVNVSNNYFENYMASMSDGGAIYVLGSNANVHYKGYLCTMNNNYAVVTKNVGAVGHGHVMGYYHDAASSHWYDYDNVLVLSPTGPQIHSYAYHQVSAGGPSFNNLTERLYVVGYRKDYYDEDPFIDRHKSKLTEETPFIGWDVFDRNIGDSHKSGDSYNRNRAGKFSYTVDKNTGAYTLVDVIQNGNFNYYRNIYLYGTFDAATDAADAAMQKIYQNAGCSFVDKRTAYGVLPE